MTKPAGFDWDDKKAAINLAAHHVSFDDAVEVFNDPDLAVIDTTRPEDQEIRTKAIGMMDGSLFTVVFTIRGIERRLISARRANAKEEKAYDDEL